MSLLSFELVANAKVAKFIGSKPKEWFNPLNWNFIENGKVANWSDGSLYMDRVPCKTDQVSFPQVYDFINLKYINAIFAQNDWNKLVSTYQVVSSHKVCVHTELQPPIDIIFID